MDVRPKLLPAVFIRRLNRFEAIININNQEQLCHVPNTGRLKELLVEGAKVFVQFFDNPKRKTKYKLLLVKKNEVLVSIDSSNIPNKVMYEWLCENRLEEFLGYNKILREKTFENSRFDFLLEKESEKCFVEVKGVTLVNSKIAKFPDAPTQRGIKHLEELIIAKQKNYRAAVVFVIQRQDVELFTTNNEIDKKFGDTLKKAIDSGIEVYAYSCKINFQNIELDRRIRIKL